MKDYKRFDNKAKVYEKYRPNYPKESINIIMSSCGVPSIENYIIADIGSGTGKFSKLLLDNGCIVYGIEPNDNMRKLAEVKFSNYKNFKSINATSESTRLQDNSIDLIICAQSFHYFNNNETKEEFKRILKANGKVILLWNFHAREDYFIQDYEKLVYKYHSKKLEPTFAQDKMSEEVFKNLFSTYDIFSIPNTQIFDLDGLWNRIISSNHSPIPEEKEYLELKTQITQLFNKHQVDGKITFPHHTKIIIGNLKKHN